jgi:hypothetical protein
MAILTTGSFEAQVRAKLGVFDDELPDEDLNLPMVKDLAEAVVAKRVPNYASITDAVDLIYLQNATMSYICYLVAPSMPRRLNTEVSTLDTKWKKASVNWEMMAQKFLGDFEESLGEITTVEVIDDGSSTTVIVNIITHDRDTI